QGLNFFGRALVAKKTQNDTDGFFGNSILDAGLYGQPSYQFVHIAPPQPVARRIRDREFILILCETNYKRSAASKTRFSFNRVGSVAAMQEWLPDSHGFAASRPRLSVAIGEKHERHRWRGYVESAEQFQLAAKMQYAEG